MIYKEKIKMYISSIKWENRYDIKKIREMKDKYQGEECWIIGNGPSLNSSDLDKIKGKYSFASNKIYYIYDQTEWRPSFYMCQDPRIMEAIVRDVEKGKVEFGTTYNFFSKTFKGTGLEIDVPNPVFYRLCKGDNYDLYDFSKDASIYLIEGLSVTYSMIQMARYMGFKRLFLLGVDHTMNKAVNQHFDQRYNGDKNLTQSQREYEYLTKCYELAYEQCLDVGIEIYNATRGGALKAFPRIVFEDVI